MEILKSVNKEGINFEVINLKADDSLKNKSGFENGILHISGQITINFQGVIYEKKRENPLDQIGTFVHLNAEDNCIITTNDNAQVAVIDVENEKNFESKIYHATDIDEVMISSEKLEGKDVRTIRNIVDMGTEPNANIVIGEVISGAGCWSSYPPHSHEQPELYYYKFNHPSGFGISVVDESATIVRENDVTIIPGNLIHPQSSAPGYQMYYIWVIRNLKDNLWSERAYAKEHAHLLEEM